MVIIIKYMKVKYFFNMVFENFFINICFEVCVLLKVKVDSLKYNLNIGCVIFL